MSKTLTLSHNQAGILIMSLAVVVAYGTEGDNDDWKLCIELISRIKTNAETALDTPDTSDEDSFLFDTAFNTAELEWLNSAAYFGICYYTLFENESTKELLSIGTLLDDCGDSDLLASVTEYVGRRTPPFADSHEDESDDIEP